MHNMKLFTLLLLTLLSPLSIAGAYMLNVVDHDNESECAKNTIFTVETSSSVSASLVQYFSGEEPDIGILKMAFANGHLRFCGDKEINNVLATLYNIKAEVPSSNKLHLLDFIGKVEDIQ